MCFQLSNEVNVCFKACVCKFKPSKCKKPWIRRDVQIERGSFRTQSFDLLSLTACDALSLSGCCLVTWMGATKKSNKSISHS